MEKISWYRIPLVIASEIVGVALIISTVVGAYAFYNVRAMDNSLSVTGSARKSITADHVRWVTNITRTVTLGGLKAGYDQMADDLKQVQSFYASNGFSADKLTISPVLMEQVYDNRQVDSSFREYTLRQTIELSSDDISKVTELSKNTQSIIGKGVIFQAQSPEYSYNALSELRVSLLSDALRDAQARAQAIAETTGKKVGKLKSASSGVVQVLPIGSVEVSDYGAYDTSSIEKDVMVTVKAAFTLN